jgi:hypothetical protein
MPLQYDPVTSEIRYEGKIVGRYDYRDGTARVSLNLTYECAPEEWVVPLSWFAYGLSHLAKHKPQEPVVSLTIETHEAAIAEEYDTLRMLTEKIVKRSGYVWVFHKTDTDQWPSALHAHDYEKNLKLDALTGDIFDAATRQRCKKLSAKELARIHEELRQSKDFASRIADLLRN